MTTETNTMTRNEGSKGRASETLDGVRNRASEAYDTARERANSAYGTAREKASRASSATAEQITANPVGAIIGGFALGAAIAAVLPKTQREVETLGGVGHKLTGAARDVARNAAEAGREQIDEITGNAVTKVGSAVVDAVASSSSSSSGKQQQ